MSSATLLHIEGERLLVPVSALDHDGFRAWVTSADFPAGVRASWVAGEVFIEMSPESIDSHNKVKAAITATLQRLADEEDLGEVYADGVLFTNEGAGVSTEPDLAFASFASLEAGRLRLRARAGRDDEWVEIEGTPDVVVEIVSDASVRKDVGQLRDAYHRAGISEYWIIDARRAALQFEILHAHSEGFRGRAPSGAPQHSEAFARAFVLERRTNRVGRWTYRLTAA